jgi:hypothetical protein
MRITVDNASSNDGGILYMKKEPSKTNNIVAGANIYSQEMCCPYCELNCDGWSKRS